MPMGFSPFLTVLLIHILGAVSNSVAFVFDSHLYQLFPSVRACVQRAWKRQYHGSAPAWQDASPLCPLASPLRMQQARQTPPVWKALYGTYVLTGLGYPWVPEPGVPYNVSNFPSGAGLASISIYSGSGLVRNVIRTTVGDLEHGSDAVLSIVGASLQYKTRAGLWHWHTSRRSEERVNSLATETIFNIVYCTLDI